MPDSIQGSERADAGSPKSSRVISRSSRVRELPPPPKVDTGNPPPPPEPDPIVQRPEDIVPEPPIELKGLDIEPGRRRFGRGRRHVRSPNRVQLWLAAPERRHKIGYGVSLVVHLLAIFVLVLGIKTGPAAPKIHSRTLETLVGGRIGR